MIIKQSLNLASLIAVVFLALPPMHAQKGTPEQIAARYQKSCNTGNQLDCIHLAEAYGAGIGVPKDENKANALIQQAASLYQIACEGSDTVACVKVGDMWCKYAKAYDSATPLYRKACDGGNAAGCYKVGRAYAYGLGATQDNAQAAAFYQKACESGNADGCHDLGAMYSLGLNAPVPQDQAQAIALFRKGCDLGNIDSCTTLGLIYENGSGVPQSNAQAALLYRKACTLGDSDSCDKLKKLGK